MSYCNAETDRNGGTFSCGRLKDHKGIHLAESGDDMDYGVKGEFGIVRDVQKEVKWAMKIVGLEKP